MKKKLAAIVLGVCMTASLAGCQGKAAEDDNVKIKSYKGVEVEKAELAKVSEEDVENSINTTLQAESESKEVKDRAAKKGDTVFVDYVGKVGEEVFDEGKDLQVEIGGMGFIEGFAEGMEGHKAGETFELPVTFPEDYQEDLAGKDAVFTITMNKITETIVPKLDDKLVAKVSEESKTVDEYKKEVKKQLEDSNKKAAEAQTKNAAWTEVVKNTELKKEFKDEIDKSKKEMKEQMEQMAQMYYGMKWEDYLKAMNKTEKDFEEAAQKSAEDQLKSKYASELIAKNEKLELSEKEYEKKYDEYAKTYGFKDKDEFIQTVGEDKVKETILLDQTMTWVADKAKLVEAKAEKKVEEVEEAPDAKKEAENETDAKKEGKEAKEEQDDGQEKEAKEGEEEKETKTEEK